MTLVYIGIALWVAVIAWSLSRAARLGDDQQSLTHAECVTRTQPHGNCDVIPISWAAHLRDDESLRAHYTDRDPSNWTDGGAA